MVKKTKKRLRSGDVLEVDTPRGLAYIQYVGMHPEYGDVIRVLPGFHEKRAKDLAFLVAQEGYMTFYPAAASVRQGFNEIVGSCPLPPAGQMPQVLRRALLNVSHTPVETVGWIIEYADGSEAKRKRGELTEAEKKLPIMAIWDHGFLVEKLCEEWNPKHEV